MTTKPEPPPSRDLPWVVRLETAGGTDAELVAAAAWERGATAIEWQEASGSVALVASFPTSQACLRVADELGGTAIEILDGSWQEAWKAFARPLRVAPSLVVAPAWRRVDVAGAGVVVEIDPGPCFGSGTHPSTRMVLAALAADPPVDAAVLDAGAGSGILSVTAALLGAAHVVAVDVDPEAVDATLANARRNRVEGAVEARLGVVGALLPAMRDRFDLAVVNVTAGVHAGLAGDVVALLRPGGTALLAGMLPGQWPHVEACYAGCEVVRGLDLDGWAGVQLTKRGSDRSGSDKCESELGKL